MNQFRKSRRSTEKLVQVKHHIFSTQEIKNQDRTYYTDIRLWVFLNDRREQSIPVRFPIVSRRTKESDSVFLSTNILDLEKKKPLKTKQHNQSHGVLKKRCNKIKNKK